MDRHDFWGVVAMVVGWVLMLAWVAFLLLLVYFTIVEVSAAGLE